MKNVTITMHDDLAATVRVDAAKAGKSMSRYIADLLEQKTNLRARQIAAMEAFLALPKGPISDENGRLPDREELYRRDVFRGRERADLQPGPEQRAEIRSSQSDFGGVEPEKPDRAEPSGAE